MLTKEEIQDLCYPTTYRKGIDLYERNRILSFDYSVDEELDYIDAFVAGSGYNSYSVTVVYDIEEEELKTASCECPAYHNYGGLCKHLVAVLLKYIHLEKEEEFEGYNSLYTNEFYKQVLRSYEELNKPELPIRGFGAYENLRRRTDPELYDLLGNHAATQFKPLLNGVNNGTIRLETVLHVVDDGITLELRVGYSRMYIVKDIYAFYHRMARGENYAYGKGLEFVHTYRAFTEDIRPMVECVYQILEKEIYKMEDISSQDRGIPIEIDDVVELISRTDKNTMTVLMHGYEKEYPVVYEDVPRQMSIQGMPDGIQIDVERRASHIGKVYYLYIYNDALYIVPINRIQEIREFLLAIERYQNFHLFIEQVDVVAFQRHLLPKLEKHYAIEYIDYEPEAKLAEEVSFKFYLDAPTKDRIHCKVVAVYGDEEVSLFEPTKAEIRDKVSEDRLNAAVSPYFTDYDEATKELYIEGSEERLYQFLTDGLSELDGYGDVYLTDKIKRIHVLSHVPVKVGVSIESQLLELTVTSERLDRDQLEEILNHYNPRKKYYRLKDGQFVSMESTHLGQLYELKEGLGISGEALLKEQVQIPKYRALYVEAALKGDSQLATVRHQTFKALIREMTTIFDSDVELPSRLQATLRGYQEDGFRWIKALKRHGFGGILADDMGLGKTLQVISFLLSEAQERKEQGETIGRSLVICPSSLVYNWAKECERFAPDLHVTMISGDPKERRQRIKEASQGDVLITSYDLLKRDLKHYEAYTFAHEIIDEGQFIKNQNTQVAKAVKGINAEFRLALTGTPIENRLSELWSLFDYLMPGFLYSYRQFKRDFETPIVSMEDHKRSNRLKQMIQPFVLRRLKRDVLKDLPDKIEENILVEMGDKQKALYDAHVMRLKESLAQQSQEEFNAGKMKVFAALTRLRQLCCDPRLIYENYEGTSAKIDMCMELIHEAVQGGHKVLLFSQFTSLFEGLHTRMDHENISYMTLTGKTSKAKRAQLVDAFNRDDTSVFCISLKAGGTGLNLTSADIVIHFDPWWNIAVMNQATDRAHRIGQEQVVNVYNLIARGSIEERMISLQEAKRQLADEMLSGDGVKASAFDKEALLEMLQEA